jgi:YHS domain-containing protein
MIDPVCGMKVDEKSKYKFMYKGKMYYFCSSICLKEFQNNPEKYLKEGPKGMPHGSH